MPLRRNLEWKTSWIKNWIVATHGMRRTHACSSEHMIQTIRSYWNYLHATFSFWDNKSQSLVSISGPDDLYGTVTHFSWGWLNTASYTFRMFTSWQKYMHHHSGSTQRCMMKTTELGDLTVNLHVLLTVYVVFWEFVQLLLTTHFPLCLSLLTFDSLNVYL